MVASAFLLALIIRSTSLLLPQTFFQPDEFYQALEPAHQLVFGYGYLTWEWKDLPEIGSSGISTYITAGRMRSWIWPGVFALVYKGLKTLRLDDTFLITSLPRVIGILVAASTDYATFRLSAKLMGPGSASGALFLSLTSLFNAHLLPRSLSTSPETLLVTLALVYFPLPDYIEPTRIAVGQPPKVSKGDLKEAKTDWQTTRSSIDDTTITYEDAADIDYAVMDRMKTHVQPLQRPIENLALAVFFASLAICIRPTTLPLWFFLATDLCIRTAKTQGPVKMAGVVITGCAVFLSTLAASSAIDYAITGRLVIPMLTFIQQNVFRNISAFYGGTNLSYHLVQSLPIMLFPIWWWWAQGFVACLLPKSVLPNRLHTLDRPPGMRTLARALFFTIAVLSLSPHSEWRFLHPLLPSLLLYALPPLHRSFVPLMPGCYRLVRSIRQYTRISKFPFFLCLFAPLAPWLYLNLAHGKAQVQVMNVLRRGELGHVSSMVALMPCHSTPWSSHLHRDVEGWFLTCEPPLHDNPFDHITQQEMFYQAPVTYLQSVFPLAPGPLHQSMSVKGLNGAPSHVLLFGELLDRSEKTAKGDVTVAQAMTKLGYHEVWNGWNGFDFAQDESQRRGGVRVWTR